VIQKNQPEISVIIPTFNRVHTLPRAIDSVLSQTVQSKEIIVVDDGSTDDTQAVLVDYPELRIFSKDNRGVSAARNVGIEKASGEWLKNLKRNGLLFAIMTN